jgi:hypothetical protein
MNIFQLHNYFWFAWFWLFFFSYFFFGH